MVEQERDTRAVQLVFRCLHTHTHTQAQPTCPAWMLTNPPLKFKCRIVVGSNTATEVSHGVLIQASAFLRVFASHDFSSLAFMDITHISTQQTRVCWFHHGVGNTRWASARSNPGSRRHRTLFSNCFQAGCVLFLLDFPFSTPFFLYTAQQWLMLTLWSE